MQQKIVYKNWAPPKRSWSEVIIDLLLHALLQVLTTLGTPLTELSFPGKFVKVVVPFILVWGLAWFCNEEDRDCTFKVLSLFASRLRPAPRPFITALRIALRGTVALWRLLFTSVTWISRTWIFLLSYPVKQDTALIISRWIIIVVAMVVVLPGLVAWQAVLEIPGVFQRIWEWYVAFRYWRMRLADSYRAWLRGPLPPVPPQARFLVRPRIVWPLIKEEMVSPLVWTGKSEEKHCKWQGPILPLVSPRRPLPVVSQPSLPIVDASRCPTPGPIVPSGWCLSPVIVAKPKSATPRWTFAASAPPEPGHQVSFNCPPLPTFAPGPVAPSTATYRPWGKGKYKDRKKSEYYLAPRWGPCLFA
ncbi:hypothetical protein TWF694_008031 [Orbilia ellipsospora]|uniref:Uncharacterized protein n=1 Tax=Orbilia ellipsospora TaxID=2528407 RepID=A0AAV9XI82_9PEZI